jgi:anti-sigma regulatory factor (Ser/Thr protein kinase)
MVIITYYLKNINNISKIEKFAEKEGLQCIDITNLNAENITRTNLFFTDTFDESMLSKFKDKYICCIGFTPSTNIYYVKLEEDFNIYQFRAIIDSSLKGGLLKFYMNDLVPIQFYIKYTISNRIFETDEIVFSITKNLIYFFTINDLQKIRVGLCEMITNAIEHGNLEITGDEKFYYTSKGTYIELLKSKLASKDIINKKVTVELSINSNRLKVSIEDDGNGFDTSKVKEFCNLRDVTKLHGRGIMITTLYFDKIKYNKKGNRVTLIKKIDTKAHVE